MNQRTSTMRALFLATAGFLAATPAIAQGLSETLSIDTPVWYVGNYEAQLEGFASGSVFTAAEDRGPLYPGGYDDDGFTGLSVASVRLQRLYDSGLITGLRANVLLGRDELSGDAYGNDFLQKLYFYVQTGLGRVEIGQQRQWARIGNRKVARLHRQLDQRLVSARSTEAEPFVEIARVGIEGERNAARRLADRGQGRGAAEPESGHDDGDARLVGRAVEWAGVGLPNALASAGARQSAEVGRFAVLRIGRGERLSGGQHWNFAKGRSGHGGRDETLCVGRGRRGLALCALDGARGGSLRRQQGLRGRGSAARDSRC